MKRIPNSCKYDVRGLGMKQKFVSSMYILKNDKKVKANSVKQTERLEREGFY